MFNYIRQRWLWFKHRNDDDYPDKCEVCGLRVSYPHTDTDADTLFNQVSDLRHVGVVKYPSRVQEMGVSPDRVYYTHFCALSHNKYWGPHNKRRICPDWQLKIPGDEMSLPDYISVHHSRVNTRLALRLGVLALILTLTGILVSIYLSNRSYERGHTSGSGIAVTEVLDTSQKQENRIANPMASPEVEYYYRYGRYPYRGYPYAPYPYYGD
ncbi:hypothetical protein N9100_00970 [Gammaproteobacteria bacterium]|nr:hypothetical protein [Gammaproteobacteria bacterium]